MAGIYHVDSKQQITLGADWFPTDTTREGRMLSAGQLEATITSRETGQHITLLFKSRKRNELGRWKRCSFRDADVVFVEFQRMTIGWLNPKGSKIVQKMRTSDAKLAWAMQWTLRWAAGVIDPDLAPARMQSADRCGHCRIKLTDPQSIDRGIGPTCFGKETQSKAAQVSLAS